MPNISYNSCYYLFILLPAKGFVIFTCRYFKFSGNTTALSQSNCRNFSCKSKIAEISTLATIYYNLGARQQLCRDIPYLHDRFT